MLAAQEHAMQRGMAPLHYIGLVGSTLGLPMDASLYTERERRWATRDMPTQERPDHDGKCRLVRPGLWRVSSYGYTVARAMPEEPFSLTYDQIVKGLGLNTLSLDQRVERAVGPWLAVYVDGRTRYLIDANETLFVFGDDVSVAWVAPRGVVEDEDDVLAPGGSSGFFEIPPPLDESVPLINPITSTALVSGLYLEGLLWCDIARVEASRQVAESVAQLTQLVRTAIGATVNLPIPNGARRVTVRADVGGAGATNAQSEVVAAGALLRVGGRFPIVNGSSGNDGPQLVSGLHTHLQLSNVIDGAATNWTVVWEIAP